MPVILDIPAMLGKPYRKIRRTLARFPITERAAFPEYETNPLYQGGKYYVYKIGPPKDKGSLAQEADVSVSANGIVTRFTVSNLEGLGDTLDQADKALSRFGIIGPGEPDIVAPAGRNWNDWHNMTMHVVSGADTDKVWQVQVSFAGG